MDNYQDITFLLNKHLNGEVTEAETTRISAWVAESPINQAIFERLNNIETLAEDLSIIHPDNWNNTELAIWEKIQSKIIAPKVVVHRVHFLKTAWFRYAAAIILILGIGAYMFTTKLKNIEKSVVAKIQDKEPGKDQAILTLSDGRKIILNDSTFENISDGSISIEKANGKLTYNTALTSDAANMSYNTMATPRGGQYQLILPDGSKVWMNSASTLKYPTQFSDKERTVELSGEAYFDIKANKKMPFIVKTKNAEVLVLGTEFNINSYSDEPEFSATLVNGSVKVSAGNSAKIISPGQQAQLFNSKPNILEIESNVDINQVVAWQKGIFTFKGVSLDVIARQLSRWYDIEIVAGNNKTKKLSGGISKKTPLKAVLKMLEIYGVTNKWENNIIILNSN